MPSVLSLPRGCGRTRAREPRNRDHGDGRRKLNTRWGLAPMSEIQGIARLQIHDGKLEEFKRVASQCMQVVRTKDTGTLQYELYFNEDQLSASSLKGIVTCNLCCSI